MFEEEEEQLPRRRQKRNRPQTTTVRFFGEVFTIPDTQDPDEVIERFVASGSHKRLERCEPDTAVMLTKRFISHQEYLRSKGR